ncbi:MAG: CaiB/BaiF CoA transferase family protein [Anaerolineae bacterium]
MSKRVLSGIKVIDLSIWLPGPYCSMILGDLGAEIIKVERRLLGDPSRHTFPFVNHESCHFLTFNRNKKSIALNLRRDEGREILLKLAATADVVLESYKPGYVDEVGIGYEDVRNVNARIVYCSLSGYGQDGPYAQRAGHDINYAALGGLLDLMPPTKEPVLAATQIADLSGALFASVGILAALVQRNLTGTGTYIDVGMLAALTSFLSSAATAWLCGQPASEGYKYLAGQFPGYNLYRTKDGRYMALGIIEPTFWADFCRTIGREDLAGKQLPGESERQEIITELQQEFAQRTQAAWIEFFADKNLCCEPVNSLEEALAHPQLQHHGMLFHVEHPAAGTIGQIGLPIRFRGDGDGQHGTRRTDHDATSPSPLLGQHTLEIMHALGYSGEEISRLRKKRVIATSDDTPPPTAFSRRRPAA